MVDLVDYGEGAQNAVYYVFLSTPFVYGLTIAALHLKGSSTLGLPIGWHYYLTVLYGIAALWFAEKVKKDDWAERRKSVHKPAEFYSAHYQNNLMGLALPVSAGTIGMLVFLITGDLPLPGALLVLSLIGLMKQFPTDAEMLARREEITFTNEQV